MRPKVKLIAPVALVALLLGFGGAAWADVEIRTSNTTEGVQIKTGNSAVANNETGTSTSFDPPADSGGGVTTTGATDSDGQVVAVAPDDAPSSESGPRTTSTEGSGAEPEGQTFEPASEKIVVETFIGV